MRVVGCAAPPALTHGCGPDPSVYPFDSGQGRYAGLISAAPPALGDSGVVVPVLTHWANY